MTPMSDVEIRDRAYALWEQAGRPEGQDMAFWMMAERELSAQAEPQEAQAATPQADEAAMPTQPLPDQDMTDLSEPEMSGDERTDEQPLH